MDGKENKTNMKNHSFEEVIRLDQSLQRLALYEVTGGLMLFPKSPEEQLALELKVAKTFNYFKTMIKNGECTYDFIKWHVLDKNGPFIQKVTEDDDPNNILDWEKEHRKMLEEDMSSDKQETLSFIKDLMDRAGVDEMKVEKVEIEPVPKEKRIPPKVTLESLMKKKKKDVKKNK